jgi:hypothetical protein
MPTNEQPSAAPLPAAGRQEVTELTPAMCTGQGEGRGPGERRFGQEDRIGNLNTECLSRGQHLSKFIRSRPTRPSCFDTATYKRRLTVGLSHTQGRHDAPGDERGLVLDLGSSCARARRVALRRGTRAHTTSSCGRTNAGSTATQLMMCMRARFRRSRRFDLTSEFRPYRACMGVGASRTGARAGRPPCAARLSDRLLSISLSAYTLLLQNS